MASAADLPRWSFHGMRIWRCYPQSRYLRHQLHPSDQLGCSESWRITHTHTKHTPHLQHCHFCQCPINSEACSIELKSSAVVLFLNSPIQWPVVSNSRDHDHFVCSQFPNLSPRQQHSTPLYHQCIYGI